jgi:hypothetical protein
VVFGNALEELTLQRVEAHARAGFVALTANEEVNLLFAQAVRRHNKNAPVHVALDSLNEGVTQHMVERIKGSLLFGGSHRIGRWEQLFDKGSVELQVWERSSSSDVPRVSHPVWKGGDPTDGYLPLVVDRAGSVTPVADADSLVSGDVVTFAIDESKAADVETMLESRGWVRVGAAVPEVV